MSVLCVGNIVLDIVNVCERYPNEDAEVRAVTQWRRRGGNAANLAVAATAQFEDDAEISIMATLPESNTDADRILDDLQQHGVNVDHIVRTSDCHDLPTSFIVLSRETGSRTIVHHRPPLRELMLDDYNIILSSTPFPFTWIHWEGRNILETFSAMLLVKEKSEQVILSVEVEKKRDGIEDLVALANVVFVSKSYAQQCGLADPEVAAKHFFNICRESAVIVIPWGELGAWCAFKGTANIIHVAAPKVVVTDSVGAGDCFMGTTIAYMATKGQNRMGEIECWSNGYLGYNVY